MVGAAIQRVTARQLKLAALALFLIYSWPGFIGWDTREHFLQSRAGHYTDGHPPAIAVLFRFTELFVAGPAPFLLMQAVSLLYGLDLILRKRLAPRAAALSASLIFLFPFISGVTGLIAKDCLMAGSLVLAIGLMLDDSPRRHRFALLLLLFASLMRWNALAATFAPMILLFRWHPRFTGVRRYAIALVAWLAVTFAAYAINEALTDEREYLWYWGYAYPDIAGTINYMPEMDDATMEKLLEGVPLVEHDNLHRRFHELYNPAKQYHLMRDKGSIFLIARNQAERDAIGAAWKRIVFGNPGAYLRYRYENFRLLVAIDRPPTFSRVYVWFNVIAAPEVIAELDHDAAPSRIQAALIDASVAISLSPLYYLYLYFAACLLLLPLCRKRLEIALILSAIGYELQWFFLAATADLRYSQWMVICTLVTAVLVVARLIRRARPA
ncbi:MAG: hypothetical protein HOV81_03250 [Kofleriaceae bacterium]|nr:hypothetical protein [Kofleriaceae bacterium]